MPSVTLHPEAFSSTPGWSEVSMLVNLLPDAAGALFGRSPVVPRDSESSRSGAGELGGYDDPGPTALHPGSAVMALQALLRLSHAGFLGLGLSECLSLELHSNRMPLLRF